MMMTCVCYIGGDDGAASIRGRYSGSFTVPDLQDLSIMRMNVFNISGANSSLTGTYYVADTI